MLVSLAAACFAGAAPAAPATAQTAAAVASTAIPPTQYLRPFIRTPFVAWPANDDPSSLRCRWGPAKDGPLRQRDGDVEGNPEPAGDDDARPGHVELEVLGPVEDEDPELLLGAAEVLADDGADHRQHRRHLQAREQEGQRGRDPHAPEDRQLAGGVGLHQLERLRPHRAQPPDRVDE